MSATNSLTIKLDKCFTSVEILVKYTYDSENDTRDTPGYTSIEIDEITCDEDILSILSSYTFNQIIDECNEKILDYELGRDGYDQELKFGED